MINANVSCFQSNKLKSHKTREGVELWYSPENGLWVCAALKTPFSHPPGCSLRPTTECPIEIILESSPQEVEH